MKVLSFKLGVNFANDHQMVLDKSIYIFNTFQNQKIIFYNEIFYMKFLIASNDSLF